MADKAIITLPVLMRGNLHEPVKVGNLQYNTKRNTMTVRLDLPVGPGEDLELFGEAVKMGLVEGMNLAPLASEFAGTAVAAMDELNDAAETPEG